METELLNNNTNDDFKKHTDILAHKDIALQKLNLLLTKYANDPSTIDKVDKLSYWLEDYSKMLNFEDDFKPNYLKSYKRGDVVKVNLGYNIGNEEGGLHYCIVVDKHNSKSSGIITVIPLTSDKGKEPHFSEVPLGNEIYTNFIEKYKDLRLELSHQLNTLAIAKENKTDAPIDEIVNALDNLKVLRKIEVEMSKMKKGSIALVSQITTISKQRIYDPQKTGDILSGLRISDESLDLINKKMKQLFIKD